MARSNDLRELIMSILGGLRENFTIGEKAISYELAEPDAMFPHIVFSFQSIDPTDMGREDYSLDIDVWDKDQARLLDILDAVRDLFAFRNDPQESILPTFYFQTSGLVEDPDKTIRHGVVRFEVQNYRRS